MRLRRARLSFPKWVATALEKESGLNDPMSVLLTMCLISNSWPRGSLMVALAAILFYEETGGGAPLLRWLPSAAHNDFAALWLRLYAPLPTLRRRPRGRLRKARGRCRSLLLHLRGVSPHAHCGLPAQSLALRPARLLDRPRPPLSRRSIPPVTQQNRSSATRAIDNSLHGTFLHW